MRVAAPPRRGIIGTFGIVNAAVKLLRIDTIDTTRMFNADLSERQKWRFVAPNWQAGQSGPLRVAPTQSRGILPRRAIRRRDADCDTKHRPPGSGNRARPPPAR